MDNKLLIALDDICDIPGSGSCRIETNEFQSEAHNRNKAKQYQHQMDWILPKNYVNFIKDLVKQYILRDLLIVITTVLFARIPHEQP